ncbi:MAG: phosphatase PAP2 family protein [Candidatus Marinimicrobia bacterium]|jgi:undecaprenyl-diphosphatase|nr:phosphatase PAP2 family protein [Candidatus Neomarinimicrobiota bacterium]|tara:strand:- start:11716 stop:12294 length:579 start_codon:yes stop_codon:yes gene_type:complete
MISWLDAIDKSLFHFFNNTLSNTLFDILMPIITNQGYWAVPILILLLYLFVKGGKRGQVTACLLIITVVATDAIAAQIIKPWIGRLRPSHVMTDSINLLVPKGGKFSFVSNHAANIFSAATVLTYFYSKWKNVLYTLAALVAFSRVYVGVHYPGDIFFGGLFGYGMAWVFISLWVILKMREIKRGQTWVLYE